MCKETQKSDTLSSCSCHTRTINNVRNECNKNIIWGCECLMTESGRCTVVRDTKMRGANLCETAMNNSHHCQRSVSISYIAYIRQFLRPIFKKIKAFCHQRTDLLSLLHNGSDCRSVMEGPPIKRWNLPEEKISYRIHHYTSN